MCYRNKGSHERNRKKLCELNVSDTNRYTTVINALQLSEYNRWYLKDS